MVNWKQVMDRASFLIFQMVVIYKYLNALKKKKKFGTVKKICHHLEEWI
jgi:hypothetical protein